MSTQQFEIVLRDKAGAFADAVERLVKAGLHIKSATLTYEGSSKGARPVANFVVSLNGTEGDIAGSEVKEDPEAVRWSDASDGDQLKQIVRRLGTGIKPLKTRSIEVSVKRQGLVETLRGFHAAGGNLCSFLYIDRGDPQPFASATFFEKG